MFRRKNKIEDGDYIPAHPNAGDRELLWLVAVIVAVVIAVITVVYLSTRPPTSPYFQPSATEK